MSTQGQKELYKDWGETLVLDKMDHMIVAYDPSKKEEYPIGIAGQCDAFKMLRTLRAKGHVTRQVYLLNNTFLKQLKFEKVMHVQKIGGCLSASFYKEDKYMRFTWEVVQQEGADVVVRYRRVWIKGDLSRPIQPSSNDMACGLEIENNLAKRNDLVCGIDIELPSDKSVNIFGSLEVNAILGSVDLEGYLEVVNYDGIAEIGSVLQVNGLITLVEKMGKDYMVKGRVPNTAGDDLIKTSIDIMVKNDYLKHRLVGMRGELVDA